jgi:hypothetical protein
MNDDLKIPLSDTEAPAAAATSEAAPLPTIEEAKAARAAELAALPLPHGSSAHVLSSVDREPRRPYVEKLPNGTVVQRN